MGAEHYRGFDIRPHERTIWKALGSDPAALPERVAGDGVTVLGPGVRSLTVYRDAEAAREHIDSLGEIAPSAGRMTAEALDRADRLICEMIKSENSISPFVLSGVYKDVIRAGVLALTPALDELARKRLAGNSAGAIAGPNGFVRGLVLKGDETSWLVRIRDQWDSLQDLPASMRDEGEPPAISPPGSIDVYSTRNPQALMRQIGRNGWASSIASVLVMTHLESRRCLGSNSGSSLENWRDFFRCASRELQAEGVWPTVEASAAKLLSIPAGVKWRKGLDDYDAGEELAWLAIELDGGVPGAVTDVLTARMDEAFVCTSLAATLWRIREVLQHQAVVMGVENQRHYNDGEDHLWIERKAESEVMFLRDQNRSYVAVIDRDRTGNFRAVQVHSGSVNALRNSGPLREQVLSGDQKNLALAFEFANGRPILVAGDQTQLERIKDWNGFLATVGSVHAELTEEIKAAKPPSKASAPSAPSM